ncbi:hypothetical protein GCK72_019592 [Caenorhabditis remanei]|uniref:DUF38 domain-containing protein n=1 Tax=Caenorhabditis remanei TaxID=31234 RepID=A0A6A5GE97_CAERE|nr:hypothetical protein GCK72_019592 [Caenorhabditis remanei]KAF1753036.1 hypothetical protein GCK72_019592 [Caenorhabditis remanei]
MRPITSIGIFYSEKTLKCELYYNKPYGKLSFDYKKSRKSRSQDDFLKSFIEDVEEIINNQACPVYSLKIKYSGLEENYKKNKLDPVINQIFNCLKESIKSRNDILQVKRISIDAVDKSQAMSVVKLLDPSVLKKVEFCFENRDDDITIDDALALVEWNEGQRMKLAFKLHTISSEHLESVKKCLLHVSTFTEIFVYYQNCAHDNASLREMIDVPLQHETPGSTEKFIKFRLSNRLLQSGGLAKLTLSNDVSAKVLENPLIMKRVIQSFGFWDIQRLRKTSRGIRNCVDFLKPVTNIKEYSVDFSIDIHPCAHIKDGSCNSRKWKYGKHETSDDRDVLCQKAQDQVLNDFEVNLANQNTCLEELNFIFSYLDILRKREKTEPNIKEFDRLNRLTNQFCGKLKEILSRRNHILKVKKLKLECVTDDNVMQILPYLDPNCLKDIHLIDPGSIYRTCRVKYPESSLKPFVLDEICQLEQWKNAKELEVHSQPISTSIQEMNITHFSNIRWRIDVDTISSEDVLYLKDHFLLSTTFKNIVIRFKNPTIDYETLHGLIGPPYRIIGDDSRVWYFQMEVEPYQQFLKVSLHGMFLEFCLVYYIR